MRMYLLASVIILSFLCSSAFNEGSSPFYAPVTLSGSIELPAGHIAGPGGMEVYITTIVADYEYQTKHAFSQNVRIPAGGRSTPFSLRVTATDAPAYRLRFFHEYAGYMRSGYYSSSGAIAFRADTPEMWISVASGDVSGLRIIIPADPSVLSYADFKKKAEVLREKIAKTILKPYYTEFEKTLVLHDYLIQKLEYYTDSGAELHRLTAYQDIYNDPIPLMLGVGICGSYSDSFRAMGNMAGLVCETVVAFKEVTDHAWNRVKIGSGAYHLDTTVDGNPVLERFSYCEFLLTDEQFERSKGMKDFYPGKGLKQKREPFTIKAFLAPHLKELRAPTYRRVFGNISLPPGEKAGPGGVEATFYFDYVENAIWAGRVWIPPGQSHASFVLPLFRANKRDYTLRVDLDDAAGGNPVYCDSYYSSRGAVPERDRATLFDPSEDDVIVEFVVARRPLPALGPEPLAVSALVEGRRPVRIKNSATGLYLFEGDGKALTVDLASADAWILERAASPETFVRIVNQRTGHALSVEGRKEWLECGEAGGGWWSAQWTIGSMAGDSVCFDNRWRKERIASDSLGAVLPQWRAPVNPGLDRWMIEAIAGTK